MGAGGKTTSETITGTKSIVTIKASQGSKVTYGITGEDLIGSISVLAAALKGISGDVVGAITGTSAEARKITESAISPESAAIKYILPIVLLPSVIIIMLLLRK